MRGLNRFILAIVRVYLKLDGIFCSCDPVSGAQRIKYKPSLLLLFSPAHPHPCFSTHSPLHRHLPGSAQLSWATDHYADHVCLCAALESYGQLSATGKRSLWLIFNTVIWQLHCTQTPLTSHFFGFLPSRLLGVTTILYKSHMFLSVRGILIAVSRRHKRRVLLGIQ